MTGPAWCVWWMALVAVVFGVFGGESVRAQEDRELVVAAYEVEPFVVRTGDVPGGFMFEIWEQIASRQGWSFEVVWIESLDDLAELIDEGGADVAVAPLSSTSNRESRFDFSTAVVASGPVFGVHERTEKPVTLLGALFSRDILQLLLSSAVGLLVLGHLMWWAERRNPHSDLAPDYMRGVWDGVWWATVTVTTVGYGDSSPKTNAGRVVAVLAMLGSLFLVGAFVSEVTTALQSSRVATLVADLEDLDGRSVAVVAGSSYETYLHERGANTVGYPTQDAAFDAVTNGDLDIVVADKYTLDALDTDDGLLSTADPLYDEFIAFTVRDDSPLRSDINATLSDLQREGLVSQMVQRWTD